jgi:hypothetical protein
MAPADPYVTDQVTGVHLAVFADDGVDVPVSELVPVLPVHAHRVGVEKDRARCDGVHRRTVWGRDVDAEVERVLDLSARAASLPRVVEDAPYRMLLVERLDRPTVGPSGGRREERRDACRTERHNFAHARAAP